MDPGAGPGDKALAGRDRRGGAAFRALYPGPSQATVSDMATPLILEIPGEVAEALRLPDVEKIPRLRLELAVSLYAQEILGLGKAAQLADLPRSEMNRVLAQRKVPMHYGLEEYAEDLQHGRSQ